MGAQEYLLRIEDSGCIAKADSVKTIYIMALDYN